MSVTVNGHGTITGQFDYTAPDGTVTTFYGWTFPVTVDGQAGVYTSWIDSNDPADEHFAAEGAIHDLEANPGAMQGIAENDPGTSDMGEYAGDYGDYGGDYGDYGGDYGDYGDYGGDDDGGDGAMAGDGGGEVWGESV